MRKPYVIAFSGGCFSGKTTTMEKLKAALEKCGLRVSMLGELIREKCKTPIDYVRKNPNDYLVLQDDIIRSKIKEELLCICTQYYDVVLIDRAITDSLFYLTYYVDKSMLNDKCKQIFYSLYKYAADHAQYAFREIYDLVLEFAPLEIKCTDNVYRPKDIDEVKVIENRLISALNEYYTDCKSEMSLQYIDLNFVEAEMVVNRIARIVKSKIVK